MKTQVTMRLDVDLLERLRNAAAFLPGGMGLTITGVCERSLADLLDRLEAEHNNGKPFPPRSSELPRSNLGKRKKAASK